MKRRYPKNLSYYKKYKNTGSLNMKNSYLLISKELEIIEINLRKMEVILKAIRSNNKKTEYTDVNEYLKILS